MNFQAPMMKPSIVEAIHALRPNANWGINAGGLYWDPTNPQPKPTEEEIQAKLEELLAQYPMDLLRRERNRRLAECDWVTLRAVSRGESVPEEWKNYMQALRDFPSSFTSAPPLLPDEMGLDNALIEWPTPPS